MYSRLFADISNNNAGFNAETYRKSGHVLIAIKATEGIHFVDPDHRGWCLQAGGKHIAVVHYHFARPDLNLDAQAEARHFLSVALPLTGGRDYLVVDIERATPQGWSHDPAWTREFDLYVRKHSRFFPIVYASRSVLQQSDQWLTGNPKRVWDADWSTDHDFAPDGYNCVMRQFTDGVFGPEPHSLPGIEGICDVNRMSPWFFRAVAKKAR